MKGLYCAIFLVVCLGVSACGNVFNDEIGKAKELSDTIVHEINNKETFFSLIDGPAYDEAVALVEEDDGGMLIAGNTRSYGQGGYDAWLVRTDRFGNSIAKRTIGGPKDDKVRSIKRTYDGGYILAGETDSFGAGNKDIWAVKLSSSMVIEWEKTFGGAGNDSAREVFQEAGGKFILIGETDSFGEGMLDVWFLRINILGKFEMEVSHGLENAEYSSGAVYLKGDNEYVIIVNTNRLNTNMVNMLKVCHDGALGMERTLNGKGNTFATGISVEKDDVIVITGYIYDNYRYKIWAVKMDNWLDIIWDKTYDFPGDGYGRSITRAKDGSYLLSGSADVTGKGDFDMVLLNIDADGDVIKARTFDGGGFDEIESVALSSTGTIWGAGKSTSFGSEGFSTAIFAIDEEWGFEDSRITVLDREVPAYLTNKGISTIIEFTENFRHATVIEGESQAVVSDDFGYSKFY
jgi:hypothetical protein